MERRPGMVLFLASLAILIAAVPLDQKDKEPEGLGKESFITLHIHSEIDVDSNNNTERPKVSLCCHIGNLLFKNNCVNNTENGTETVQLPAIYETNLTPTNVTASNEYFRFVVWNPCSGKKRYPLHPDVYEDEKWYLLSNGSIIRPLTDEVEDRILNYDQYCLGRVKSYYTDYLVFFCEDAVEDVSEVVYSFGMLASVPFLVATYAVYWLLPELRNLHGLTLCGYVGCLAIAYSILGVLQLTPQEKISNNICLALGISVSCRLVIIPADQEPALSSVADKS
ncbi:G-protein coupled receptor Mth2-like [Linepithema humile]|uniref:G-protein coupled receptor Mth2-like n=1 Tax=Linepithema humile TaxID=83485 RepID=UPI00351E6D54